MVVRVVAKDNNRSVTLFNRHPLALLPTPLVEAPRLSRALGPRILIKRDDLTGFGGGGNKVRGLEFYLAEALAREADVIVTGAGPQSNHVRATCAAARAAGLGAVAVMFGTRPEAPQGNLLLDMLLGAEIRFTNNPDRGSVDPGIEAAAEGLRAAGRRPYVIPRGGASALGALGYVACARELGEQLAAIGARADWVVLAAGGCGTQAELLAGAKIHGAGFRVLGITVSRPGAECVERVAGFAVGAGKLLGTGITLGAGEVMVREGYIGPGYGIPTPEGIAAIRLVAQTEGLFLDPTYTGKAMAGLMGEIRAGRIGKDETVVFLHTGGEPGLFAHPEIVERGA
ncbi:MAG: D-cysteine desulfhydrase family protein [Chloroflexi bacterium]|nr:D-cysteine desulfhydrase family protein [Chloroflexota bacterium]